MISIKKKEYMQKWRTKNREYIENYRKEKYKKDRKRLLKKNKKYRLENKDHMKEYMRLWNIKNKVYRKNYRLLHKNKPKTEEQKRQSKIRMRMKRAEARKGKLPIRMVQCKICERLFTVPKKYFHNYKYCLDCRKIGYKNVKRKSGIKYNWKKVPIAKKCKRCGTEFERKTCEKYCSNTCRKLAIYEQNVKSHRLVNFARNVDINRNPLHSITQEVPFSVKKEREIELKIKEWQKVK
jgi:hypothetical protein